MESSSMLKTGQNALFAVAMLWAAATHSATAAEKSSKGAGKGTGPGGGGPVPVGVASVERKDVPIYLDGLGTVQAFNTVTVRARGQ